MTLHHRSALNATPLSSAYLINEAPRHRFGSGCERHREEQPIRAIIGLIIPNDERWVPQREFQIRHGKRGNLTLACGMSRIRTEAYIRYQIHIWQRR